MLWSDKNGLTYISWAYIINSKMERYDCDWKNSYNFMSIGSWKFGTKKMNPPLISSILTLNLQELDYIYIYVHIVPIGYIYVVKLLHKKDNWANKSCIYAYFNLHSYSYAKICLWLPIVYMCITYSFFAWPCYNQG